MATVDEAVAIADKIMGFMWPHELRWLATKAQGKPLVLELGTWCGRSAKAMSATVGGKLVCVDAWWPHNAEHLVKYPNIPRDFPVDMPDNTYSIFTKNLAAEIASGKVVPIRKKIMEAIPEIMAVTGGVKFDMIFIDADHSYEALREQIRTFSQMLTPYGILCGHDYGHKGYPGVEQAVKESLPMYALLNTPEPPRFVSSIWIAQ
jgi:predicted O-methyltransferase YrrM